MRIIIVLLLSFSAFNLKAQKVVKIVLLGEKGVVQDIKQAVSYIVMKKFPNGSYQRLNYKRKGPLQSMQTYGDGTLSFQEGKYCSYNKKGNIECLGYYKQNKKDSTWYYYNDSLKIIKQEMYKSGELVSTNDTGAIKKEMLISSTGIETEARFPGGSNAWNKYLDNVFYSKAVETFDDDVIVKSSGGGSVKVQFTINEIGDVEDVYLLTSVEYVLDEELLRIINESPAWMPAEQNGVKVKTYRRQSVNFLKDE